MGGLVSAPSAGAAGEQRRQAMGFSGVHLPPLAGVQARQGEGRTPIHQVDRHPDQAQGGQPHRRRHAPHLAVASFAQVQLQPGGGHPEPVADRRLALCNCGRLQLSRPKGAGSGLQGALTLDQESLAEGLKGFSRGGAFHLNPVAAPVPPGGIGEPMLETAVVRQQQQPLAVGIEPAGRVDARHRNVVGQAGPAAGLVRAELAENPVGLVEQQGGQGRRRLRGSGGLAGLPEVDSTNADQQ